MKSIDKEIVNIINATTDVNKLTNTSYLGYEAFLKMICEENTIKNYFFISLNKNLINSISKWPFTFKQQAYIYLKFLQKNITITQFAPYEYIDQMGLILLAEKYNLTGEELDQIVNECYTKQLYLKFLMIYFEQLQLKPEVLEYIKQLLSKMQYEQKKQKEKMQKKVAANSSKISFSSTVDKAQIVLSEKEFRKKLHEQKAFLEKVKMQKMLTAKEYENYITFARILEKTDDEIELECRDLYPYLIVNPSSYSLLDIKSKFISQYNLDLLPIIENIKELKKTVVNENEQKVLAEMLQDYYLKLHQMTCNIYRYERSIRL